LIASGSALEETAGEACLKFSPVDVEQMTKAMFDISENESLREHIITKGFDRIKSFEWNYSGKALVDFINYIS